MKLRNRAVLAYSGAMVAVALFEVAFIVATRNRPIPMIWGFRATWAVWTLVLAPLGALLAVRVPRNPIGWLFLGAAGVSAAQQLAVDVLLNTVTGAPFVWALWAAGWLWVPAGALQILALLLFPDGRPKSRLWAIVASLLAGSCVVNIALIAFASPTLSLTGEASSVPNPFRFLTAFQGAAPVADFVLQVTFLLAIGSLLSRRIGADQVLRHQLRWLAYTVGVIAMFALVFGVGSATGLVSGTLETVGAALLASSIPLIPVGIGVAVLRYRLYDIDRIVSRTVAYAVVLASLSVAYVGVVLALQRVLRPVTGGRSVAVAVSTLVVFAAFRPAAGFVRERVDRRFNRTQYDAQRTIEDFAARLREEIELDALVREMKDVAQRTMQPAHVGVWLPPG